MNEERKRILQMVKDGKLTIDEAMSLLDALEQSSQSMKQKESQILHELSNTVHFQEKKEETDGYKNQSTKDKIFDFVDSTIKKLKEIDLDFSNPIEVSHIFQQGNVSLKDIQVDIANGNIHVIPWDQNEVRIECIGKAYRVHSIEEARERFMKDVLFSIEGKDLRFTTKQKWMKIDVKMYVPETEYNHIKIKILHGAIHSERLSVNDFKVKTANGKIFLTQINSPKVEAKTINGKIFIENSQIIDLETDTINGAITVDGIFQKLNLQSFHGNITGSIRGSHCDYIDAKGVTGSITIALPEFSSIYGELTSNLGGFLVEVDGIQILEEKNEVIQKLLRFKSIHTINNEVKIKADTKTGSIKIEKNR